MKNYIVDIVDNFIITLNINFSKKNERINILIFSFLLKFGSHVTKQEDQFRRRLWGLKIYAKHVSLKAYDKVGYTDER